MTEYQERRAQYLRDAHDWAEDGDLPDASADYSTDAIGPRLIAAVKGETTEPTEDTFTSRLDAITALVAKAAYEQGRADERADVLAYMANDFVGSRDGLPWGVDNFIEGIREEEHVGWLSER